MCMCFRKNKVPGRWSIQFSKGSEQIKKLSFNYTANQKDKPFIKFAAQYKLQTSKIIKSIGKLDERSLLADENRLIFYFIINTNYQRRKQNQIGKGCGY